MKSSLFIVAVLVFGGIYLFSLKTDVPLDNFSASVEGVALNGTVSSTPETNKAEKELSFVPKKLDVVRALYVTMYTAATPSRLEKIIIYAKKNNINALVVDVKETEGILFFPLAAYDVHNDKDIKDASYLVRRGPDIVKRLRDEGFYLVGRIVVFTDNKYVKRHEDLALRSKNTGVLWKDKKRNYWIDPTSKEYWNHIAHLGEATIKSGFDEVNFDYIRFPSDGSLSQIAYPRWDGVKSREEVIGEFFKFLGGYFDERDITISADIFGQTLVNNDDMGIGQRFENALQYFDVVAPMTYPSHYIDGFAGYGNPAEHPYEVIDYSLKEAIKKSASSSIPVEKRAIMRPWLQVFDIGAVYDGAMIRKQIKALEDNGFHGGYMLWSPSNNYPDF